MCNKEVDCLEESFLHSDTTIDHEQNQAVFEMDNHSANPGNNNDESPRVKFLCSFSGSILPRPQDGKLRYVGGETRIVSVPRDISYEELMARMRELYEGAAILKYQQPDEDLDALVSVVNDDDVMNMMEEYDKLGSGDGFTKLRIFLFSHLDQDLLPFYIDGDDRDNERRYVDALNNLNESTDFRRQQQNDSPVMTPLDEFHIADRFFNSTSLEGGLHIQRNYDMPMAQYNLRHLAIPNMGSGQHGVVIGQRYNEEAPWSPAYYSPRCAGPHDPHTVSEFPSSPSSARLRTPFAEVPPEEYSRLQMNHQPQFSDNVVWLPTGGMVTDKGGFPGNILQGPNVFGGNNVCENCRMTFQRNQSTNRLHDEQSHIEQPSMRNGFIQAGNACVECLLNREVLMRNTDLKLRHGGYTKEQSDPWSQYGDSQFSERGWVLQHQLNHRAEEPRAHISGAGRVDDHYIVDGVMNVPIGHGNLPDGHHVAPGFIQHDDTRYIQSGAELENNVFHGQAVAGGSHIQIPLEERGVCHVNHPFTYGGDNACQLSHGHPSAHVLCRNILGPVHAPLPYDPPTLQQIHGTTSPGLSQSTVEGNPRFFIGVDQHPWVESSQKRMGIEGTTLPEYPHSHASNPNSGIVSQEAQKILTYDSNRVPHNVLSSAPLLESGMSSSVVPTVINNSMASSAILCNSVGLRAGSPSNVMSRLDNIAVHGEGNKSTSLRQLEVSGLPSVHNLPENEIADKASVIASLQSTNAISVKPAAQQDEADHSAAVDDKDLSFLPELVASVKKAKLESVEVVKARAREHENAVKLQDSSAKNDNTNEKESPNGNENAEWGSDNENPSASKIEPTKAEEEAIARGLQTIRNDDLEEIRELGSGTYGAVYHGKWKGSDVAIKRIKASCFDGRPSERERLIADFWKEALLLSSLHHPNVVSFYGVVRDGPDGSLATVTEFMVNGSLKQYLQKKDRTIDRRKRLIIAMDAAFGMEYLHGKNIVHFDLKCENLLVNMRDPHRPVCKIGDLGLSKVKQHTLVSGGVRGTLPWMAPELLSGKSNMVTEKIDVYSFGIVMWELLTGDEPYAEMHCASIIGGIVNNTLRPQIPTWCDPEWKPLMETCWASDPAERPSFSEISQKLRNMAAAMNVK
ncbi:hypothetical protein Ancab_027738 [Ancistrocladus abbreviatus]